jgi:glycosyltransferase involved in cell wall biosynthesis
VSPPSVTVLVPLHDQGRFLPRALGSLLAQDRTDWQAWVLDDGSTDGGLRRKGPWTGDPRLRTTGWPGNRGLGATLNAGLDLAEADVVAYLPADDVWYPDHLDALLHALADPAVALAVSGVRHHGEQRSLGAPPGFGPQLVQVAHRRTADRWLERATLESDDLGLLLWDRLRERGRTAGTGRVTCDWTDHPDQRHKAIRESFDGGLNVFRRRYRVSEPLRLRSTDSGTTDEVEQYRGLRERDHPASADGLTVLLVGELAFNPERVLALAERGHRLHGLWTPDGLGDGTVGPLPFGHVADLPSKGWPQALRDLAPDVVHAQLNWRAVPFAAEVRRAAPEVPFVWHFKEAPQRSIVRGEWPVLAELVAGSDACLLATEEEREWFELALPGQVDPGRLGVLDGDLPKRERLAGERSRRLSDDDGRPHTVVVGRPSGLDGEWVLGLARAGVHVHLHGQVAAPGPKGAWRSWLGAVLDERPDLVHLHPAVPPQDWVRVLSRYDAGWLHRFASHNGGDLRRASWDDLNSPARLPVLLAAGLPPLQPANPGSRVAAERVLREAGTGILYDGVDDLVDRLRAEVASRQAADTAWRVRHEFTFDAHADRLVSVFGAARAHAAAAR